jgi:hypothetical protein
MQQLINHATERSPDPHVLDRPLSDWHQGELDLPRQSAAHLDDVDIDNAASDEQLLRYRNRRPITARRYDYLWNRVAQHLPWVAAQGITMHWLRHTTLTWVERNFSYAVARAYAGHEGGLHGTGITATYVRADLDEVATALAALTGEPHPLANTTTTDDVRLSRPPAWWHPSP